MRLVILGQILSWEIIVVVVLVFVLFGGSQLPKLARSIGQAKGELEKGLKEGAAETNPPAASSDDTAAKA